jgi:DNA repair protein RecN (Recombination protein N)
MLNSIEITNYALIQHVRLDLKSGLTAITGETGSGKSIIMGALGLLLGERADSKALLNAQAKCVIEATFDIRTTSLKDFFQAHDLDHDDSTTIRREIAPGGKSRAFINDTPVALHILKEFGDHVIDIHSQHENQLISARSFRFGLVDAFLKDGTLSNQFSSSFHSYQKIKHDLRETEEAWNQMLKEQDYRLFQLNELEQLQLRSIDQKNLESERDQLGHADSILQQLNHVQSGLDDDQNGALQQLRQIRQALQKVSAYSPIVSAMDERLQSVFLELKELSAEVSDYSEKVMADPARLDLINEQLSALYHAQQKHRVQSVEELIHLEDELRSFTHNTSALEDKIKAIQSQLTTEHENLRMLATELTKQRTSAAKLASREIEKWFKELGLEQATITFDIKPSTEWHQLGADEIEWLFSANKGVALQPLNKVASGGEISRVMLAIKATLSQRRALPILILDEIDQGVSGEVGKKIGQVLKSMSQGMQLLTITHLAQIAGQAEHHFKVSKRIENGQTLTYVEALNNDDRITELAEMISGKTKSEAALANARELLN